MTEQPAEGPSDLDRLLGAAVEAATRLLSADGEFYPFAVALTAAGEVVSPAVDPGTDHPSADAVVQLLVAQLRDSRDGLRAVALCSDVRLKGDDGTSKDAIRVELEAPGADPVAVVVPYADRRLDQPFGMPSSARVFT